MVQAQAKKLGKISDDFPTAFVKLLLVYCETNSTNEPVGGRYPYLKSK